VKISLIIFTISALIGNEYLENKFHPLLVIAAILIVSAGLYVMGYIVVAIFKFIVTSLVNAYLSIRRFISFIKSKPLSSLQEDFSIENINKTIIKSFNYLLKCKNDDCYFKMMTVVFSALLLYWVSIPLYFYYKYLQYTNKYSSRCYYCKTENSYGREICSRCGHVLGVLFSENIYKKYYDILESHKSNSDEEIKYNYRRLVKIYHPDKIALENRAELAIKDAEDKMQQLNNAYEKIREYRKEKSII